jgi:putative oxidoreductase
MSSTIAGRTKVTDWPALTAVVGRIGLSALFLEAGVGKLLAPSGTVAYIEAAGLPFPPLAFVTAIAIELAGALALLAGYKVRWTAGLLALFSIVTAVIFHSNWSDHDQVIHFLKNFAIAGGMLHVAIVGGGRFSLDSRRPSG